MTKRSHVLLFLISLLATTLALNSNLTKKYFFVSPDNHLSQEMFQTQNGIIAHSIERSSQNQNQTNYTSQYVLIDIQSQDASPILADIVRTCEVAAPVFQHLHYHVQTDSLVYFCPSNASLLVIDQSSYTVKTSIPFNIQNSYPQAQLTTDGQNIAILCMDTLFIEAPQTSTLVKVDMQTQQIAAAILLTTVDRTVAYASSKNAAYIATINGLSGVRMITTLYSIVFIGNAYQIGAPIISYRGPLDNKINVITKLLSVGDYILINNVQDLYVIYKTGALTQKVPINIKPITADQNGIFQPLMTSRNGNDDLYIISNTSSAVRYTFDGPAKIIKEIGPYGDIQVAYGNLTSRDLMFAIDSNQTYFNILDLQTLKPIYTSVSWCSDLLLTNATYSVIQKKNDTSVSVHIFDLANDTLIVKIPMNKNYYFTKEQGILSFFNQTEPSRCYLQHVNLINGSTWNTNWVADRFCSNYSISNLTLNIVGSPRYVASFSQDFELNMYGTGFYQFTGLAKTPSDTLAINQRFDYDDFYFFDANPSLNNLTIYLYFWDSHNRRFYSILDSEIANVSANNGFFFINQTTTLVLSSDTLTVIQHLPYEKNSTIVEQHPTLADWNSATHFQDSHGTDYAILTQDGFNPALWTSGGFVPFPESRNHTLKANSAGSQSYWIVDAPSRSIEFVRLYDTSGSRQQKAFISI